MNLEDSNALVRAEFEELERNRWRSQMELRWGDRWVREACLRGYVPTESEIESTHGMAWDMYMGCHIAYGHSGPHSHEEKPVLCRHRGGWYPCFFEHTRCPRANQDGGDE